MVGSILALGVPGLGRKERQRGRGLRTRGRAGVEFRAIGNVPQRTGYGSSRFAAIQETALGGAA